MLRSQTLASDSPTREALSDGGILTPGTVFDEREVSLYYSRKTADILYKYGPGPRVYFHVGLFDSDPNTTVPQRVIRQRLIDSQEAVLDHAARSWRVAHDPPARVLDIGCGVGGGSLYWAQKYGSMVIGLTVAAEHVPIVVDFARQAGVADLVGAELGDIHELRDERVYDAAVAIESSGYMDRERLFSVVAKALKPSGWFGIQEHFLRRPEWAGFLDRQLLQDPAGDHHRLPQRGPRGGFRAGAGRGHHRRCRRVLGAVHGLDHCGTGQTRQAVTDHP